MKIYVRGNLIPEAWKGEGWKVSDDKKYWRCTVAGRPLATAKPYLSRKAIALDHAPGTYEVRANPVGKPPSGIPRKDYDRLRRKRLKDNPEYRAANAERQRRLRARRKAEKLAMEGSSGGKEKSQN